MREVKNRECTGLPPPPPPSSLSRERRTSLLQPLTLTKMIVICVICVACFVSPSHCTPINRQAGISENVYITVQNDTYGNEHRVCSIESMTYEDGESIPTSSPCEHCICRPPGFACTIISCDYRPGCKALKRSNQCCPEYQCECEKDGKIYQNGEKILDDNNPCEVCYCQGGDVVCAVIDCYWRSDCQPRYIENRCCPLYDHCPPPSDVGPILPTTRPTTTTTPSPPISWFNVSQMIPETAKPHIGSFGSSSTTELIPVPPEFTQHVVLIPTPVEQSPPADTAEHNVQGSTSDELGSSSSNEVPQGSSQEQQELPQIIIQPNEPSVETPAIVEVRVPEVPTAPPVSAPAPTESELPVVAEGVPPVKEPEPVTAVPAVSEVPTEAEAEAHDRTPEPPVLGPVPSEEPAAPFSAVPSVIYNEIQHGNEVVPPEVHPVTAVSVEPSESVSSTIDDYSTSSFYQPSTPVPVSTSQIEASEVNMETSQSSSSAPALVTEALTHGHQTYTLSSQQIITITPTRSFMTELSTETVVHTTTSWAIPVPPPNESGVLTPSVTTSPVVQPTAVPDVDVDVVSSTHESVPETTEPEVNEFVPTTTTEQVVFVQQPSVPAPVELQVSVDVVPASEAPAEVEPVGPPEAVAAQDPVPVVESETEPSSTASVTVVPSTSQEEPGEVLDFDVQGSGSGDGDAVSDDAAPVEPTVSSPSVVEEKIVVIESQPEEPATSPPEIVTTSQPVPEELDPNFVEVNDDKDGANGGADDAALPTTSAPEQVPVVPVQEEKIVIIESQPEVPATSSPEDIVPTTVEPDVAEELQDEKIVVIESDPIVPATSAPEIVTTVQQQPGNDEELGNNEAADDQSVGAGVEENLVEIPSSSTAAPEEPAEPTTSTYYSQDVDDTVEIAEIEPISSDDVPTTHFPAAFSSETVTNAPLPPSSELMPPVHDFQPRPEEENELDGELYVSDDVKSQEPVALSQVKPEESHERPSVIFNPPLNIMYLPAVHDEVPTTTGAPAAAAYTELPAEVGINELVFDLVPQQDQPADPVVATEASSVAVAQDEPVPTTGNPQDAHVPEELTVVHDDSAPVEEALHDETTTVPPPIADREEDTIEIALNDQEAGTEAEEYSSPTTVPPPAAVHDHHQHQLEHGIDDEAVHDGVEVEATTVAAVKSESDDLVGVQHDDTVLHEEVYDGDVTTTGHIHDDVASDATAASPTDEPIQSDSTDIPPGSKYRLDLSIFEDADEEGSGIPPQESVTVFEAKHDHAVHADDTPTTQVPPSELIADNLVVFDDPKPEPEKSVPVEANVKNEEAREEVFEATTTTVNDDWNDESLLLSDGGSGSGSGDGDLSRHHHPDHVEGSGHGHDHDHDHDHEHHHGDHNHTHTRKPSTAAPLSRHHHPDHVEGSGSGDGDGVSVTATAFEDEPAATTEAPTFENDIVPIPEKSVKKSDNLPRIPPHLVKPVAPISPDMEEIEGFSRADHSVQSEAEAEVARADESWFWRTFNKIMTLPDYLRSARRPRRSADANGGNPEEAKAFHKKNLYKQLKKGFMSNEADPSNKKYKEWSLFPRFLLW